MQPDVPSRTLEPGVSDDIQAVNRIDSLPQILRLVCEITGMRFAAVARVTERTWTACAVRDEIGFGLGVGEQLALETTLCHESRLTGRTIAFDQASADPVFANHHTPRIYGIESYVSVPIVLASGQYFGNLCAIDPSPARVSDPRTLAHLKLFSELIASQLALDTQFQATHTALLDERAASDLREHFMAVLGHDLRNPLTALGASAAALETRSKEPETVRTATAMRLIVRRMATLIDDVMDLARSRLGGGMGARFAQVDDLGPLLRAVVEELRVTHPDRDIRMAIDVGAPVDCDAGRIQQMLSNLLANAVTHGAPDQPIRVEATIEDGSLVLSVANGGPCIPPDALSRVFEPYWRPASSKPGGGLGLGLYICAQIAKAHHGTIEASSGPAETRFRACIPIRAA